MLIDSHCHLDFPDLQSRLPEVLAHAAAAGIGRMVSISTLVARFDIYRALAEAHPDVFFTVGTHPHNAAQEPDIPAARLVGLSAHPRCQAVVRALRVLATPSRERAGFERSTRLKSHAHRGMVRVDGRQGRVVLPVWRRRRCSVLGRGAARGLRRG